MLKLHHEKWPTSEDGLFCKSMVLESEGLKAFVSDRSEQLLKDRTRHNYQGSQGPDVIRGEKIGAVYRKVGRTKEIMESKKRKGRQQEKFP